MEQLEDELVQARDLDVATLADAIESIGFECTRCGACCKGYGPADGEVSDVAPMETDEAADSPTQASVDGETEREPHTATVFPDEVRDLTDATGYDWRDVARPMPYGLEEAESGEATGETFEWALQTDACGDCTFFRESGGEDGQGACAVHEDRPLICRTYPFSVALGGTSQPMGKAVDSEGMVRAHECEGLGRDIDREEAEELAAALKERAVREIEEAISVRDRYDPVSAAGSDVDVIVHDSEGPKRIDGTAIEE